MQLGDWTVYVGQKKRVDPLVQCKPMNPCAGGLGLHDNGTCVTCPLNTFFSYVNYRCECLAGYYCPYVYNNVPPGPGVLCPNNWTSLQDARSIGECFCKPGFKNLTTVVGYSNTSVLVGYVNVSTLVGYDTVPTLDENGDPVMDGNGDPVTTQVPRYEDVLTAQYTDVEVPQYETSCQPCTAGYMCPDNKTQTICEAGNFSAINSTSCSVCPVNTYSSVGSPRCTNCFSLTVAPAGSTSIDNCTCQSQGWIYNGTFNCVPCPANKYCTDSKSQIDCLPNSVSVPGSFIETQCLCVAGFQNASSLNLMAKYAFEDPDPKLSAYTINYGKPNIMYMGSAWYMTSAWKAFGSKSIVTTSDLTSGDSKNYIRFAPNLPFNFVTNNYTFSFVYRWAASQTNDPMTFIRVGPMQVGLQNSWAMRSSIYMGSAEPGCISTQNWGYTSLCDKHTGSTFKTINWACASVSSSCTGDVVYYFDGDNQVSGQLNTAGRYHIVVTNEAYNDGKILMRLYVNGNEAHNGQTVNFDHLNKNHFTQTYYGGYIGVAGDGTPEMYPGSRTALAYIDELQVYDKILNSTERAILRNDVRFEAGCAVCGGSMYCPGGGQEISCPLSYTSPSGASSLAGCAQCANNSTNTENPTLCTSCMEGYIYVAEGNCRPCSAGYACPNKTAEIICAPGTHSPPASRMCFPCVAGVYCPGDATNNSCPLLSTSPAASTSINQCTCVSSGFVRNGTSPCRACTAGYFCPNSFNESICPVNTYTVSGYTSCVTCPANSYYSGIGGSSPFVCVCSFTYYSNPIDTFSGISTGQVNFARSCNGNNACPITTHLGFQNTTLYGGYQFQTAQNGNDNNVATEHNWADIGIYQIIFNK